MTPFFKRRRSTFDRIPGSHDEKCAVGPSDRHATLSTTCSADDLYGDEGSHDIRFKTLSWPMVAGLMISEVVSNGMLSLPSSLAVVGIVPGVILIVFLGLFGLFTAWLLIRFKRAHPHVHSMGDAGMVLFGPLGREIFMFGTIAFAIAAVSGQLLAGQLALSELSDQAICSVYFALVFAAASFFLALPRTLGGVRWLAVVSCISITVAGVISMIGAGLHPVAGRTVVATVNSDFYTAFLSITNPVFSYAGHFLFFVLISEMERPEDAMKAAWTLQSFATTFYTVFAIVMYTLIGSDVASPAFSSLTPLWSKLSYGLAIPNFLICGAVYIHVGVKIVFTRMFRTSRHLHSSTVLGYVVWISLIFLATTVAFILAVAVPIFSSLIGVIGSLFASWYTYGIAGMFWIYDAWHGHNTINKGWTSLSKKWFMTLLSIFTILAGAFFCVAGTYVSIRSIANAYSDGTVGKPFTC